MGFYDLFYFFIIVTFEIFIYLFWLHQVLVTACGIFAVACGIFSCGMQDLFVAACGLLVAACGLSCIMHVGSSSPTRDQTQAPCIASLESYPLDHQGSPL